MFKNYYTAKGVRSIKFGLYMDVRWNATYLMLKHLVPYSEVFSVFINSNYRSALLSQNHWYVAEKVLEFLKLFYDCTVVLPGVCYPTSPLAMYHVLEIATHLHACERDQNLRHFCILCHINSLNTGQTYLCYTHLHLFLTLELR
jgi:hypothetical protein